MRPRISTRGCVRPSVRWMVRWWCLFQCFQEVNEWYCLSSQTERVFWQFGNRRHHCGSHPTRNIQLLLQLCFLSTTERRIGSRFGVWRCKFSCNLRRVVYDSKVSRYHHYAPSATIFCGSFHKVWTIKTIKPIQWIIIHPISDSI